LPSAVCFFPNMHRNRELTDVERDQIIGAHIASDMVCEALVGLELPDNIRRKLELATSQQAIADKLNRPKSTVETVTENTERMELLLSARGVGDCRQTDNNN
jgi:hypothetical protein